MRTGTQKNAYVWFMKHVSTTLQQVYAHPDVKPNELAAICEAHERVVIPKGEYLLREGHTANAYWCVEVGLVRTYVIDYTGHDITTGFIGSGEIAIDVVSLFKRVVAVENMQALTEIVAWRIDFQRFQELFHSIATFAEWGRAWMSQSLFAFKQRSVSMITDSATQRYLDLQRQHPEILLQAPLKHIATYLGITDTSLSRIRKEVSRS